MEAFLTAVGLVLILEGIPYFIAPDRMRDMISKLNELPDSMLRQTGFMLMVVGLLVVYLVRG
ncbi:MAG: DUF2065 domain-containing protein [Magnetococcales bacterium]|nr:DUF2065 domain-containing protein [Magnetococcales bacterium]